jgi:hypothetical protein
MAFPSPENLISLFLQFNQSQAAVPDARAIPEATDSILSLCTQFPLETALLCTEIIMVDGVPPLALQQAANPSLSHFDTDSHLSASKHARGLATSGRYYQGLESEKSTTDFAILPESDQARNCRITCCHC